MYCCCAADEVLEASAARNTHAKRHVVSKQNNCQEERSSQPAAAEAATADVVQGEDGEEEGVWGQGVGRASYRSDSVPSSNRSSSSQGTYSLTGSPGEGDGSTSSDEEGDMIKDFCRGSHASSDVGAGACAASLSKQHAQHQQQHMTEPGQDREEHGVSQPVVLGVVGEPNVGKSSLLNVLLGSHRVAVSSHPGRTKHLQTHYMTPHLMVCDCPGLVFPRYQVSLPMQVGGVWEVVHD